MQMTSTLTHALQSEPELILAFAEGSSTKADWRPLARTLSEICARPQASARTLYYAARAAELHGDWDLATAWITQALLRKPQDRDIQISAARFAQHGGMSAVAIDHLKTALALGADFPDVHQLLGEAYLAEGKRDEAIHAFERAVALNPQMNRAQASLDELRAQET